MLPRDTLPKGELTGFWQEGEKLISGILAALAEALRRCEGPSQRWTRRNLKRAMVLVGGLDEKVAREILEQEEI